MNHEDKFEERLHRQPPREVPTGWRVEMLQAARAAIQTPTIAQLPSPVTARIALTLWRELIWPCRQMWAGLAVVWVVLITLHLLSRDHPEVAARKTPPPSPEMLIVLRQQNLLLAELVERPESRATDRPKVVPPRPRSQGREKMGIA